MAASADMAPDTIAALLMLTLAPAQQFVPPADCKGTVHQLLDFWVGSWDVTLQPQPGSTQKLAGQKVGTNEIEKTLGGCAIIENWKDVYGSEGKSLFYYHPSAGVWKQVWVTDLGRVKEKQVVEAPEPHSVRFQGEVRMPNGTQVLDRTTLTQLSDGRVRQHIEQSKDSGKTWESTFDAIYTKRAAGL